MNIKLPFNDEKKDNPLENIKIEDIVAKAIEMPGVKVNRTEFLCKTFENEKVDLEKILELGPVEAKCSKKLLARKAEELVKERTTESALTSFVAGIPGGWGAAVAIPLDLLQFFGMALRMAQELIYLYGAKDLWKDGMVDDKNVRNQLILYCGVMFGVGGAASGVRLFAGQLAKEIAEQFTKETLKKKLFAPVIKQICKVVGVKVAKETTIKGASKIVPVVGGVISGGMTLVSMRKMGKRLADTLHEAKFNYSREKAMKDYRTVEGLAGNEESAGRTESDDAFEKLEKLAKLKDSGVITEEEFNAKKAELLERI